MAETDGVMRLAQADTRVRVPLGRALPLSAAQLAQAAMVQQGNDLVIVQPNGPTVQVTGYFATPVHPDLQTADGQVVAHQVIEAAVVVTPGGTPPIGTLPDAAAHLGAGQVTPGGTGRGAGARGGDALAALLGGDTGNDHLGQGGQGTDNNGTSSDNDHGGANALTQLLGGPPIPLILTNTSLSPTTTGSPSNNPSGPTNTPINSPSTPSSTPSTPAGPPDPTFPLTRSPLAQDSGNPGSSSPSLPRQFMTGTSGDDSFTSAAFGQYHTTQVQNDGSFQIDDGVNGAQTFNTSTPVFTYQGVTFDLKNPLETLSNPNDHGTDWFTRTIDDTYAGLAGNDTINGGAGQDVLLGDFDLPAKFGGPLTSSTADDPPASFTPGDDTITGGSGSDIIYGGGGHDSMSGGTDDDLIIVPDLNFTLADGGTGQNGAGFPGQGQTDPVTHQPYFPAHGNVANAVDTLRFVATDLNVDLTDPTIGNKIKNFEQFDLGVNGHNTLTIKADTVFNGGNGSESPGISGGNPATDRAFFILGGSTTGHTDRDDTVKLTGGGWAAGSTGVDGSTLDAHTTAGQVFFNEYHATDTTAHTVHVYVQTTITHVTLT